MTQEEVPLGLSETPSSIRYEELLGARGFLRAPKMPSTTQSVRTFVSLHELALVKLGLKTGADDFFFLERLPVQRDAGELLPARGSMLVKGMDKWQGELAIKDVEPALLNPHQVDDGTVRPLVLLSIQYVYFAPRAGKLRLGGADYVRLAEHQGVHQRPLVLSNGSDDAWYRQIRSKVTSEWVLPYNSAYDYGAWRNPNRAVLNGRFVGVEPRFPEMSDLLAPS